MPPDDPDEDEPVKSETSPLEPSGPEEELPTCTSPLEVTLLEPLTMLTEPPEPVDASPPDTYTDPPTSVSLFRPNDSPPINSTSPPSPPSSRSSLRPAPATMDSMPPFSPTDVASPAEMLTRPPMALVPTFIDIRPPTLSSLPPEWMKMPPECDSVELPVRRKIGPLVSGLVPVCTVISRLPPSSLTPVRSFTVPPNPDSAFPPIKVTSPPSPAVSTAVPLPSPPAIITPPPKPPTADLVGPNLPPPRIKTVPPTPFASDVSPALIDTSPPEAPVPSPTERLMLPPRPDVDAPEWMLTSPESPF